MLVRVYEALNGQLRVVYPSYQSKSDENNSSILNDICMLTEQSDPSLKGLPFIDVDHSELPDRSFIDEEGDRVSVRNTWTMNGKILRIDLKKLGPDFENLYPRLRKILSASSQNSMDSILLSLFQAIKSKDIELIKTIQNQIIQHPSVSAQEIAAVKKTFRVKGFIEEGL